MDLSPDGNGCSPPCRRLARRCSTRPDRENRSRFPVLFCRTLRTLGNGWPTAHTFGCAAAWARPQEGAIGSPCRPGRRRNRSPQKASCRESLRETTGQCLRFSKTGAHAAEGAQAGGSPWRRRRLALHMARRRSRVRVLLPANAVPVVLCLWSLALAAERGSIRAVQVRTAGRPPCSAEFLSRL
jgi:hypothetical protein